MSFVICEKHKKIQKSGAKVLKSGLICMNRYCPNSYRMLCVSCKNEHKDHTPKILTMEDLSFLVQKLPKLFSKQTTECVGQTLDIMKKLKLIKEFRKKIDILEKQVQKQSLKLIEHTQSLLKQYEINKECIQNVTIVLQNIENIDGFRQFCENSSYLLSNFDFNSKKDKLELINAEIKDKEVKRKKILENAKRKIEEVRDYSMKIIEVILHNEDSQVDEDDTAYIKKHYDVLKSELCLEMDEKELESQICSLKASQATNKSRIRKSYQNSQCQTQAHSVSESLLQSKIQEQNLKLQQSHLKSSNDLLLKLSTISREKDNLKNELTNYKQKFEQKRKVMKQIQNNLRQNKGLRGQKQKLRDEIMNKIIELWQVKGMNDEKPI